MTRDKCELCGKPANSIGINGQSICPGCADAQRYAVDPEGHIKRELDRLRSRVRQQEHELHDLKAMLVGTIESLQRAWDMLLKEEDD